MEAWRLRRNVLRRDLRSAVRELNQIAEQRAAGNRVGSRRFRRLSEPETEALVGAELLATLAASASAPK